MVFLTHSQVIGNIGKDPDDDAHIPDDELGDGDHAYPKKKAEETANFTLIWRQCNNSANHENRLHLFIVILLSLSEMVVGLMLWLESVCEER